MTTTSVGYHLLILWLTPRDFSHYWKNEINQNFQESGTASLWKYNMGQGIQEWIK